MTATAAPTKTTEPTSAVTGELSRLVEQSSHYVLGMGATLALGFVSFPLFTRIFSVADYGSIDFAQKIILLVTTLAKAGMQNSAIRFYDRKAFAEDHAAERSYFSTMFFGVAALSLVVTLAFLLLMRAFSGPVASILLFSSVLISLRAIQSILWAFLRTCERTKTYNVVSVVMKAGTILAILMLMPWAGVSVRTYFLGMMLVEGAVVACVTFPLARRGLLALRSVDPGLLKASIAFGFPLIIQELFGIVLDSGDRAVVQHYAGADALGFYSVAYGLSTYVNSFLIAPLGLAITPIYMGLWNEHGPKKTSEFLSRTLDLFLLVAFAVIAVVCISSHDILLVLASKKYQGADQLMPAIVAGLLFYTTQVFTNAGLIIHKKTGQLASVIGFCAVLNIGLNCLLVPRMGLRGAALVTLWSYAICSVLVAALAFRFLALKLQWLNAGRYLLAAGAAMAAAFPVELGHPAASAVLRTAIALGVYGLVLFLLDARTRGWACDGWSWLRRRQAASGDFPAIERTAHRHSASSRPCHILFIFDQLNHLDGGAERALLRLVHRLPRDRFRVSVATFCAPPDRAFLRALECPVHCFAVSRCVSLHGLKVALKLRKIIREQHVGIVQTFFASSDLWGSVIARLSGCSIIVSSRRDMGFQLTSKHRIAYRLLSPLFKRVHTVSEAVRQFTIRQDRIDPRKVVTIPNGVRLPQPISLEERIRIRAKYGIDPDAKVIVDVGNISPVKGFEVLIRAATVVCAAHPKALFVIVGKVKDAAYFRTLEDMVNSLGLNANVRFIGFEANPLPLVQASDMFCHLSSTDGLSNALLEAMSASLPCVITAVGGNPEVVENGRNGFVVEPGDHHDAADRICSLLEQPRLSSAMGTRGRQMIEANFTEARTADAFIAMYDELLQDR